MGGAISSIRLFSLIDLNPRVVYGMAGNMPSSLRRSAMMPASIASARPTQFDFKRDPTLGPAYAYWCAKRGERAMPRPRDIDPSEISPRLLPFLQITELLDGGSRIRYRLVGTAIVTAYGAELTGKHLDEVASGDRLRFVEDGYRRICREKRPLLVCNRYMSTRETHLMCNRIAMPLSDVGETVDRCITAMSFHFPGEASEWSGEWLGNSGNFDFTNSYSEIVE
jgi:hypothetical protein